MILSSLEEMWRLTYLLLTSEQFWSRTDFKDQERQTSNPKQLIWDPSRKNSRKGDKSCWPEYYMWRQRCTEGEPDWMPIVFSLQSIYGYICSGYIAETSNFQYIGLQINICLYNIFVCFYLWLNATLVSFNSGIYLYAGISDLINSCLLATQTAAYI